MKKITFLLSLLLLVLLLSACGPSGFNNLTGSSLEPTVSVNDLPDEQNKDAIIQAIKNTATTDIEALIGNNFHLLDVVTGENERANIYATKQFTIQELVQIVSEELPPDETSDLKDNQQILIYPNHFVTFKISEEDDRTLLIEVASDRFVRNNYSPNFLGTYFAIRLLDDVLDVDDWGKRRRAQCSSGGCYGGYSVGGPSANRGMSTFRGGGPSSGK